MAPLGAFLAYLRFQAAHQPSQFPCSVTGFTSPGLSQTISPHLLFRRSDADGDVDNVRRHPGQVYPPAHGRAEFDITAIITITYSSPGRLELWDFRLHMAQYPPIPASSQLWWRSAKDEAVVRQSVNVADTALLAMGYAGRA